MAAAGLLIASHRRFISADETPSVEAPLFKISLAQWSLHKALFIESNPSPAKFAAKLLGLCSDDVRLPLVKIQESTKEKVKEALLSAKLL